jgi:hypothetical protein
MPNVVVYVPAAVWRDLRARHGDSTREAAAAVRDFARQGWEALRDGSDSGAVNSTPGSRTGASPMESAAPEHFKPDPKPGRR